MKKLFVTLLLIGVLLQGCAPSQEQSQPVAPTQPEKPAETPSIPATTTPETPAPQQPANSAPEKPEATAYHNDIFKDVTVKKMKADTFEVKGKAKVFEAVLNYSVEDGHNELAKGSATTSAGAPEWGDFSFTLTVKKATPNSTLMLILFESSAKDGSRRMELPIPLPE
ncbi:sporulation protein [Brevibacillus fluminis]|uniref:Sporulation protein n=1 Tax=Brevibacillus fluminis TaxID=511487 RepID=A0A3M8CT02_9BACL|nr:Gmad2 immunoglobulin-like domain-containing protein [Brevibacillus fluminis]RNB78768.1 sporulation protein [Brevibacillus fluminis]